MKDNFGDGKPKLSWAFRKDFESSMVQLLFYTEDDMPRGAGNSQHAQKTRRFFAVDGLAVAIF